jgi:peroxisomal membrane protein 2
VLSKAFDLCVDGYLALCSLKKVLVDQLTYGPLQNALFMAFLATAIEGRSWPTVQARLVAELPAVQARAWRVWPVASFISQELIPLKV